jgi:hypothetical protein
MPYVRDPTLSEYAAIALFLVFECFYILHTMGLIPVTRRLLQFLIVCAATTASTETSTTPTAIEKPAPIFQPAITHAATTAGRPFSNPPYIWERCPGYDPQRPRPRDLCNDFTDEERAAAVRWGEERLQKSLLKRKIANAPTIAPPKNVRFNPVVETKTFDTSIDHSVTLPAPGPAQPQKPILKQSNSGDASTASAKDVAAPSCPTP